MIAGYLAIVFAYVVCLLLITRLGRKVLMDRDCVSTAYTLLLLATWFVSAAAGAWVCCGLSPLAPYGPMLFPSLLAAVAGLLVFRNVRQLPGQQNVSATAGIFLMIVAGTVAAIHLHHHL